MEIKPAYKIIIKYMAGREINYEMWQSPVHEA
jgi:hypothetical protein